MFLLWGVNLRGQGYVRSNQFKLVQSQDEPVHLVLAQKPVVTGLITWNQLIRFRHGNWLNPVWALINQFHLVRAQKTRAKYGCLTYTKKYRQITIVHFNWGVFRHSWIIQNYFKLFRFCVGRNWNISELFCFILFYAVCLKTTLLQIKTCPMSDQRLCLSQMIPLLSCSLYMILHDIIVIHCTIL